MPASSPLTAIVHIAHWQPTVFRELLYSVDIFWIISTEDEEQYWSKYCTMRNSCLYSFVVAKIVSDSHS